MKACTTASYCATTAEGRKATGFILANKKMDAGTSEQSSYQQRGRNKMMWNSSTFSLNNSPLCHRKLLHYSLLVQVASLIQRQFCYRTQHFCTSHTTKKPTCNMAHQKFSHYNTHLTGFKALSNFKSGSSPAYSL